MPFDGTLKFDTAIDQKGFKLGLNSLGSIAKMGMAAVTGAITAATGAVAALGTKAVSVGKEFESGMSQVQATLGLSITDVKNNIDGAADTMAALTAKAEEMGATTAFTAAEAAEGLNILAMSGYDAESSIGMIENVLNLASAGSLSLADAASYAAGSMKGFVSEAENFSNVTEASAYYADMIAKGATLAATDVSQLGEAMSQAAATADMYGQTSQATEVALLRLAEQNETGSNAATMLAATMKNLYAPTDQAKKVLEELGVSAFEAGGKARDFNEVVGALDDALNLQYAGNAAAKIAAIQDIFGIQGAEGFSKLITASGDTVEKFYNELEKAGGSAAQQKETMLDNLEGDITLLESALDGLYNAFYKDLNNPLRELAQLGIGYISELTDAFTNGGFTGAAEAIGGILSSAVTKLTRYLPDVIGLGTKIISSLTKGLTANSDEIIRTGIDIAMTLFSGFGEVSVDLLELGAGLLTSLAKGVEKRLPRIRRITRQVMQSLSRSLTENLPVMLEAGASIIETLGGVILENLPLLISTAIEIIRVLANYLCNSEILSALVDAAFRILLVLTDGLLSTENLSTLLNAAIRIIETICKELLTAENVEKLLGAALDIITALVDAIVDNTDDLLIAAETIVTDLANDFTKPENIKELVSTGVGILTKIVMGILQIAGKLAGFALRLNDELNDELFGGSVDWAELGASVLDGVISGLFGIDTTLISDFTDKLHETVADAFGEQAWNDLGSNAARGILTGMLSSVTGVDVGMLSGIGQFASQLTARVQEAFDIHSPSRLMRDEVGKYLALGIGEGFTEEMPDVGRDALGAFDRMRSKVDPGAVQALSDSASAFSSLSYVTPPASSQIINNYSSNSYTTNQTSGAAPDAPTPGGDIIIPVNIGGEQLDTIVIKAAQIANARSGGVTI